MIKHEEEKEHSPKFHIERWEAFAVAASDDIKNIIIAMADRIRELEKQLKVK